MSFSMTTEPDCDDIEAMIMSVWNRCSAQIYKLCKARTMDEELAADLSQEIFIKFFGSVSKWRHHCNIAAWLFLVARRHCIDYFRKRKRYESFYGSVPVCEEQVFYSADNRPNYCYDEWRDEKTIELFLEKLTSLERMLLEIRFLGGYSFEEIYLIFGISKSNAAKMMNRALDKIYLFYEGKG